MKRSAKIKAVEMLHDEFTDIQSSVLLDYKGLNVQEITELRAKLREVDIDFRVVKNTLSIIAAKGTDMELVKDYFKGPTAITISKVDPVAGIKVLDDFIKQNPKLSYKAAVVEGAFVDKDDIAKFANLPSRDVLLGRLLATMQAPVSGLARVLAGNITGLMNVLNGIKDAKEGN